MTLGVQRRNAREALEDALQPYIGLSKAWWRRDIERWGRAGWEETLLQVRHIMPIGIDLLRYAGVRAERSPDLREFAAWCHDHADEEAGEDMWLEEDMRLMGFDQARISDAQLADEVLRLIGAQFALVAAADPVAVLGYCFVIEVNHIQTAAVEQIQRTFNLPAASLRTFNYHAANDDDHAGPILDFIERYSRDPARWAAIQRAAIEALLGWTSFYRRAALAESPTVSGGSSV